MQQKFLNMDAVSFWIYIKYSIETSYIDMFKEVISKYTALYQEKERIHEKCPPRKVPS